MKTTKSEIRRIALDFLSRTNPPLDKFGLEIAIAKALARERGLPQYNDGLSGENSVMFDEVFWDLIVERVITPTDRDQVRFRLHSAAWENLKKLEQARERSVL
jgi:hypothetical protein